MACLHRGRFCTCALTKASLDASSRATTADAGLIYRPSARLLRSMRNLWGCGVAAPHTQITGRICGYDTLRSATSVEDVTR